MGEIDAARAELGEILDRLAALADDAFAERSELLARQHGLREALRRAETPEDEETARRWADRSARKPREPETPPVIPSPTEGGLGF